MLSISMQKRAGLLYLAKSTGRILLILENGKWAVPTFERNDSLLNDASFLLSEFISGKIIPIELYQSVDKGFEYGTYICLIDEEILSTNVSTIAWCSLDNLPSNLHNGLKSTLNSSIIKNKILTVLNTKN